MEAGSQTHSLGRYSTLNLQCPKGISEIIEFLLKDNIDLNEPPTTLAAAASTLPQESVELFLKKGASANSQYKDGETCLHTSVRVQSAGKFDLLNKTVADSSTVWNQLTAL